MCVCVCVCVLTLCVGRSWEREELPLHREIYLSTNSSEFTPETRNIPTSIHPPLRTGKSWRCPVASPSSLLSLLTLPSSSVSYLEHAGVFRKIRLSENRNKPQTHKQQQQLTVPSGSAQALLLKTTQSVSFCNNLPPRWTLVHRNFVQVPAAEPPPPSAVCGAGLGPVLPPVLVLQPHFRCWLTQRRSNALKLIPQ